MHWSHKYMNYAFVEGGRKPDDGGFDCYGLTRYALQMETGILLPELSDVVWHKKDRNDRAVAEAIRAFDCTSHGWFPVEDKKQQAFDILIIKIIGPFHMGLAIDEHRFLNIELGSNTCVESNRDIRWQRRIHACWRHGKFM